MEMKTCLSFDDVLLTPRHSSVISRGDVDISANLRRFGKIRVPIISAPMDTVTGGRMAREMFAQGGLGIIHRYISENAQFSEIQDAIATTGNPGDIHRCGAAVGATGNFLDITRCLVDAGAEIICVDVAHGDHVTVLKAIESIRRTVNDNIHIMAGNIATREAFDRLVSAGADSIRVGVGGGSVCSTRIQTGHGIPTLWSVMDCASSSYAGDVSIIADGGIRTSGDAVKALAAGADAVMLGSMLSGTDETIGDVSVSHDNGKSYKKYRGMASVEAQVDWRGHYSSEEGVTAWVECKGPLSIVIDSIVRGIRSGLSYSGALNITELQTQAKFIRVTSAGIRESTPHIYNKS